MNKKAHALDSGCPKEERSGSGAIQGRTFDPDFDPDFDSDSDSDPDPTDPTDPTDPIPIRPIRPIRPIGNHCLEATPEGARLFGQPRHCLTYRNTRLSRWITSSYSQ